MNRPIHFIVSRSREGWAVSVEADRLSEHADLEQALDEARKLVERTNLEGDEAEMVDLSAGLGDPARS